MPRTRSLAWSELKIGIVSVVAIALAMFMIFLLGSAGGFCLAALLAESHVRQRRRPEVGRAGPHRRCRSWFGGRTSSSSARRSTSQWKCRRSTVPRITSGSRADLGQVSLLGEGAVDITPSSARCADPGMGLHPDRQACADDSGSG